MKSLVAEDDATSRVLLQTFLSQYGECEIAVDGKNAVDAIKHARLEGKDYDLVCMDLNMPVMNGQLALREIRRQEAELGASKAVKIIVTTSHSDMDSITNALLGKCNSYLVKPIDIKKLVSELQEFGLIG